MASVPKTRFLALDSWRGICALLVALFHLDVASHIHDMGLVRHAWMLVDFFFVLSGFVIAFSYGDKLGDWHAVRQFALRRFGRIWPLHAAMLVPLIVLALAHLASTHQWPQGEATRLAGLAASLALVHSLDLFSDLVWNQPSWSISVEAAAYVVFALYCLVTPARWRALVAALLAATGLGLLARFSHQLLGATYDYGFFRCIFGFFAGVLTSIAWRRYPPRGGTAAEVAMVAALAAFLILAPQDSPLTFAAPILFAATVWIFAGRGGRVSRLLESRAAVTMGTLSYSLYMTHFLISRLVASALVRAGFGYVPAPDAAPILPVDPWLGDLATLAYAALVIAVSWITWRFVEMPGRDYFNARAQGLAARHPARAAADASF